MRHPDLRRSRSSLLPIRVLAVLGGSAALAVGVIGAAVAAPGTKAFDAGIVQSAQEAYAFQLQNLSTTQTIGSANVTLPGAFTDVSVEAPVTPVGKTWTSRINDAGVIELRADSSKSALAPGEQLTLEIGATAPCGTGYRVQTEVKQSNNFSGPPGNNVAGPSVLLLDVVGPAATFAFGTIGSPQVVGTPFTVSVTAQDACAQDARYYTGEPVLSGLDTAPNGTTPGFALSSFVDGVAEASATAAIAQFEATLIATDEAAEIEGSSDDFNVVTKLCEPGAHGPCVASDGVGTTISAPSPPLGASLELSLLRRGEPFACGGTTAPAIGSLGNIAPDNYVEAGHADPIPVTVSWTLPTGSGNPTVCLSMDKELTESTVFEPVSKCGRTPVAPCEFSRTRSGDRLEVVLLIEPVDPWVGGR